MSLRLYIRDRHGVGFNEVFIDNENALPVNLAIKDFTQISGEKNNVSYFTYTMDIPYEVNAEALGCAVDLNVSSAQDLPGIELNAFLESGFYTFRGVIKITGYQRTGSQTNLKAQFLGGLKNWINLLPTDLRDLELGESVYDTATITSIFNDSDAYDGSLEIWYSLKFYQMFEDPNFVSTVDFRPDLYFAAIIRAIEETSNTPIQSNFFATEYFRRYLMPYVGDGRLIYRQHRATANVNIVDAFGGFIDLSTLDWTNDDPLGAVTITRPVGAIPVSDDEVNVTYKFSLNVTTSKTSLAVVLSNTALESKDNTAIFPGQNDFELSGTFTSSEVPAILIEGDYTILAGSTIEMEIEGVIFSGIEGVTLQHRSTIKPDVKTNDFISGLSDLNNLIWFYDENNEVLIVEPKWDVTLPTGEFVRGFYSSLADDYTEMLDCGTEEGDFNIDVNVRRDLVMAFKEDNDDNAVKDSRRFAHLEELPPKFPDGETVQRNEIFAPTNNIPLPAAYTGTTAPAPVPTFIEETDDVEAPAFDFEPRVLYKMGMLPYEWRFNNTTIITGAPIAAQVLVPDVVVPAGQPTFANLGMGDFNDFLGLSNLFYTTDFRIYRFGVLKTVNMALPMTVLLDLERLFRFLKFTNTRDSGGVFHILEGAQVILNKERISEVKIIALP